MIRQEGRIIAVCCLQRFHPFADPLMVEPLNRHNPDGVFPRVSFLTDLSIAGRKAGLLTVTERPKVSFS
jgi:hypothetical protein